MNKILTVIGARPQFIKMVLISTSLKKLGVKEVVVHTGQHYDKKMSRIFFHHLKIAKPDYSLKVKSQALKMQLKTMVREISKILIKHSPKLVLLYGDTTSTLAGAFAAKNLGVPIAHVEAGLRSYDDKMPEEINRVITDHFARYLFCPTKIAVKNLKNEKVCGEIFLTGDVMHDLILKQKIKKTLTNKDPYILCTIHRAENADNKIKLKSIFNALGKINEEIIFPLHPRTKKMMKKFKINVQNNIKLIDPVGYKEMISLEKNASLIITDSGGVQKEAFIFNVPCVTLRDTTEWRETVKTGMNVIAGTKVKSIINAVYKQRLNKKRMNSKLFYGNGSAYKKIAKILKNKESV